MKVLIFDSGPLINLSMNGLLYLLESLKKEFDGLFLITSQVKYEVIDHPLSIKKFELGALRIQDLLSRKVINLPSELGISEELISSKTTELMVKANEMVQVKDQFVKIVSGAEMSCLAVHDILKERNIKSLIAIDERTTRLLSEKPENLERMMAQRLHQIVKINHQKLSQFEAYQFIRSPEIIYVAHKKNLLLPSNKKTLEAALYATKFSGAAISFEEIEELKRL